MRRRTLLNNAKGGKYKYVDFGLPSGTLWATCNVGAINETEYGDYFRYGKGARTFQETSGETIYDGEENPLALSADTAAQVMGGDWHLPTKEQYQELLDNINHLLTRVNGVYGLKFTKNGKYIFFPAAGVYTFHDYEYEDGELVEVGVSGIYLTNTPDFEDENRFDYVFGFSSNGGDTSVGYGTRWSGLSARGVIG